MQKETIISQAMMEEFRKRAEQIYRIRKELYMPINLPKSFLLTMQKLSEEAAIISKHMAEPLRNMALFSQQIQKQINAISAVYNESFMRMAENAQIMTERIRKEIQMMESPEFLKFHEEYGWLDWIPANTFMKLYVEYRKGKFSFLEDFNKWLKDENGLKTVLKEALTSKVTMRREKYIKNIFNLHKENNCISSIPLALIQIEGIIRDFGVLKGYLENKENPMCLFKNPKQRAIFEEIVINLFGEKEKMMGEKEVAQPLKKLLTKKIYTEDIRHSILHGNKLNYDDPILSAHLIAILVSLANKATKIQTESKIKPYWEKM